MRSTTLLAALVAAFADTDALAAEDHVKAAESDSGVWEGRTGSYELATTKAGTKIALFTGRQVDTAKKIMFGSGTGLSTTVVVGRGSW